MMARSHALFGGAGWLSACAAVNALGHRPALSTVALGAVVAAGCAVAPDMDCPEATIARVFGPVSQWASLRIAHSCASVYTRTATPLDPARHGGHRTVTHTAVAGLAAGVATTVFCLVGSHLAAAVVVFVAAGLAARSLLSKRRRGNFGATVFAFVVTAVAHFTASPSTSWWWLGVPVVFGWIAHLLGDALTNSGCPILWPVVIRGRRWYSVGTPRAIRFSAGDRWEQCLVVPLIAVSGVVSAWWLLATP